MYIIDYEDNIVNFWCHSCETFQTADITDQTTEFNEQFNQYMPIVIDCPGCEDRGENCTTFLNMNLPVVCEMEMHVMDEESELTSHEEREDRRFIRDIMWDKRPDLKDVDRLEVIQEHRG